MYKLDPNSCSKWLAERGAREAPYQAPQVHGNFYLQFALPKSETSILDLLVAIGSVVAPVGESLVQIQDWDSYGTSCEGSLVRELRRTNEDEDWGGGSGGVAFSDAEMPQGLRLCAEVVNAGMTAYLYFPDKSTTLLFWEGDLADCWCRSSELEHRMHQLINRSGLRIVRRNKC